MKSVISFVFASLLLLTSSYSYSATLYMYQGNTYTTVADACNVMLSNVYSSFQTRITSITGNTCYTERYITSYGGYWTSNGGTSFTPTQGQCPSGYEEDEQGFCQEVEQPQCPKGQFDYGNGCENICVAGNQVQKTFICGTNPVAYVSAGDGGSCSYDFTSFDETQKNAVNPDDKVAYCTSIYTSTGNYIPDYEPDEPDIPSQLLPESDNRSSSSETIIDTSEPVTNPDGSISQTETKTTTQVSGDGFHVIEGDNTITIKDSDGTTTVYSENKTTVTHPDGSITETINQDTNTTTSPVNNTVITKNPPSVTNITNEGSTTYYNQTVVNQYDSNGNLTSTTTTQNGSGTSGDGGDSDKEGNCGAPGQPVCQVELSDNSNEYSDQYTRISQQESELADIRQKVVDELADTSEDYGLSGIIDLSVESLVSNFLPLPDSYTCNGITTTFLDGKIFEFEPCEDLQPLREVLAWVFFIYTLFAVHNVLLGRRLF